MHFVEILSRGASIFCVTLAIVLVVPAMAGADQPESISDRLFGETVITETVSNPSPPSLAKLSPQEIADLSDAKDVLTEIFRRLSRADGNPPLELFTDSYRSTYADTHIFQRNHFKSEAIISYRIFNFWIGKKYKEVRFWLTLRETLEGADFETQRAAILKNTNGRWGLHSFK